MTIAFKSSGAGAGTESNGAALNLVCPATVDANDILIAHVLHTGIITNPTTPSGWTLLYPNPADITQGAPLGTGTATARHWVFGKLAAGTEDGATIGFGTVAGTNGRAGRIYSFSGYVSGTLADVVPAASFSDAATETDPSGPTVATTVAGALAVALMAQDDNNSHSGITGQSGGTWGNYLEFVDSALGPQGLALAFNTCTPTADPGTVTGGTLAGANDESGTIGFEIRPNAPAAAEYHGDAILALAAVAFVADGRSIAQILGDAVLGLAALAFSAVGSFSPAVVEYHGNAVLGLAPVGVAVEAHYSPQQTGDAALALAPLGLVLDGHYSPQAAGDTILALAPVGFSASGDYTPSQVGGDTTLALAPVGMAMDGRVVPQVAGDLVLALGTLGLTMEGRYTTHAPAGSGWVASTIRRRRRRRR